MEFNRDISILILSKYLQNRLRQSDKTKLIFDGLAGVGARGIRFANELTGNLGEFSVIVNDHNPRAFKVIKRNLNLNKVKNAIPANRNFNLLVRERIYDYIDIDPFGSPVDYLDSALHSIIQGGMLGITTTDTAVLFGNYPATCLRRYGAKSLKTRYSKELGIRILLGFCVREAAKYDIALKPVAGHSSDHYLRIYLLADKGAKKTDTNLENLGYILHNFKDGARKMIQLTELTREFTRSSCKAFEYSGPLWTGALFDSKFIKALDLQPDRYGTAKRMQDLLRCWLQEANSPPTFYEMNEISRLLKIQPPPVDDFIQKLMDTGYIATRTHFSYSGVKTNANIKAIKKMFA